jgi:pyruvate,water dikinase
MVADPLMPSTKSVHHWTTTNLGEAAPGVLTPLGLALWGRPAELATRRATYVVGMFSKAELAIPDDPAEWILRPFYGRLALRLEYMATVGDRAPGTTGPEAMRSLFGDVPDGMTFSPTKRRYPAIAARLPVAMAAFPGKLIEVTTEQDQWWRSTVARVGAMDEHEARAAFAQGMRRFDRCTSLQLVGILSNFRPLYDALEALVSELGVGDLAVLSGAGGAEMQVVSDIWRASRGELSVADVQREHGFHGPLEGEVSGTVWREDARPLGKLIEQ